jgi:hypothetical protein
MILSGYLFDESTGFSRGGGFAALGLGDALPVAFEHIPMPTQNCIRLDDMQSRLPEVGEARQQGQSSAVTICNFRPFDGAFVERVRFGTISACFQNGCTRLPAQTTKFV